ncbi:MAG: sigma-70 family RNA polymerase sigma factor [Verrucomicrobiota bacterium]
MCEPDRLRRVWGVSNLVFVMDAIFDDDHTLLARFVESGDQPSFTGLVHRHGQLVFGVCYRILQNRHDAEEAAQAAFVQLAVKARKIDSGRPLAPWLHTVARQKALDSYKSRQRRNRRLEQQQRYTMNEGMAGEPRQVIESEQRALELVIDEAIESLPEMYRAVVVLHYIYGETLAMVADKLNCKPSTVSMRLTRAKEKLGKFLTRRGVAAAGFTGAMMSSLNASVPGLDSNFGATTYQAATTAVESAGSVGFLEMLVSSKQAVASGIGIAALAGAASFLPMDKSEEVAEPADELMESVSVPSEVAVEVPDEAEDPFDFVLTRAGFEDARHAQLYNYIHENIERLDELRNDRDETLLQAAVRRGNCVGSFLLLYYGADPNVVDNDQESPLMRAMRLHGADSELIRDMLIFKGADVNTHNRFGDTALIIAVEKGHYKNVEFLLWMGAELHPGSASFSRYPKALARELGHKRIAGILDQLEYTEHTYPAVEASDDGEESANQRVPQFVKRAMIEAANRADLARLEALVEQGGDINTRYKNERTLLHIATQKEYAEVLTYLIMMGADVNALDQRGMSPILTCSGGMGFGWEWCRYMLLLAGANLDIEIKNGHNSLTLAASHGNGHPLQLAIWMGVDPDARTKHGTAMHIASKSGRHRIVEQLQRNGVTEAPYSSDDPVWLIHNATKQSDLETLQELVAAGVSLDTPDERGHSPMVNAIHYRRIHAAQFLLRNGADPNFLLPNETTALNASISWNYWQIHRFREELLRAGADPNLVDKKGRTPLIQACRGNGRMVPTITQLLVYGADINYRDDSGKRAIDYARESAHDEVETYLIEMGAEL